MIQIRPVGRDDEDPSAHGIERCDYVERLISYPMKKQRAGEWSIVRILLDRVA